MTAYGRTIATPPMVLTQGVLVGVVGLLLAIGWMVEPVAAQPPDETVLAQAIARGVKFLAKAQRPSGEFTIDVCQPWSFGLFCASQGGVWITASIVYSLDAVDDPARVAIQRNALAFLQRAMVRPGVWHFWSADGPFHRTISPDTDSSAWCAFVLRRHGVEVPDNLAQLLRFRDEEGRFYTWLDPGGITPGSWRLIQRLRQAKGHPAALANDLDCVVNVNTVASFAQHGEVLQGAYRYLNTVVERGDVPRCWLYGTSAALVYYMYARAYELGATALAPSLPLIRQRLLERQTPDGSWGDDAEQAAAVISLLIMGERGPVVERGIERLVRRQRSNGSWRRTKFIDLAPAADSEGSEAFTTALGVEALGRARVVLGRAAPASGSGSTDGR